MFEIQDVRVIQVPPPASAAPQAPAAPAAPGTAVAPSLPGAPLDLSRFTAPQLRRMLEELRSQRADIAGRRSSIAGTYESATGANREGIGQRLLTIDNHIVQYEQDILRVGRELAIKSSGSAGTEQQQMRIPPQYVHEDDVAGFVFGTFLTTGLVTVLLTRWFTRRRSGRGPQASQPQMIQSNERLERIEQAVDTIALEMERVSENQRFMTRLMTETQLGDTLKDVRKSTELAKSAAAAEG